RLETAVDLDAAALVAGDAGLVQPEPVGEGPAAGGDQHGIGLDGLGLAALHGLTGDGRALALLRHGRDLSAELELEALLGRHALELLRDLSVHAAEDSVEIPDHRSPGAEARPDRAELEPDDATADDDEVAGHLLERQRAGRGGNDPLVEGDLDTGDAGDV